MLAAAEARAAALAAGDADALSRLLHPEFGWTSHRGDRYGRDEYVRANTGGEAHWSAQDLSAVEIVVVGDTAVLTCTVTDEVDTGNGSELYTMPMTQTWIRIAGRWTCLAGHTGPRSG